jgi:hypothetical protein
MGVEDFQGVIDSFEEGEAGPENVHCDPWDGAGAYAYDNCTPASDNTL